MKIYEEESLKEILGVYEDPQQDLYKLQKTKLNEGMSVLCDFSSYWTVKETSLKEACHFQNFIGYFCHIFLDKELKYKNLRYHLYRPIIFLDEKYEIKIFFERELLAQILINDWNDLYNQQFFLTNLSLGQKLKLWTFGKIRMEIKKVSADGALRLEFEDRSMIFNSEAFLHQEFKKRVLSVLEMKSSVFNHPQSNSDIVKERLSLWKDLELNNPFNIEALYFQDFGHKNVLYLLELYELFWHIKYNYQLFRKVEREGQSSAKSMKSLILSLKQNLMVVDVYHAKGNKGIASLWNFLRG